MRRFQSIFFGLILFLLAAPLPSILLLKTWPALTEHEFMAQLANKRLIGVTLPTQDVTLSLSTWLDASFQQSVTKWVNENFAGREFAIRWFNQLLWSTCRKSYMYNESIIAGRDNQLFEKSYLNHYKYLRPPLSERTIKDIVDGITWVKTRFSEYNVPFLILITPSRAITLPDTVPAAYRLNLGTPRTSYDIDNIKKKLIAAGIPVLDGAELTRSTAKQLPLPPFPKTGTHWTDLAAFHTAEAVLRKLEHLGTPPLARLQYSDVQFTDTPRFDDADLLHLLNLARPCFDHYAYATISRKAGIKARQGRLVVVGGSFVGALNRVWEQAEVWREIDYYFYFKRAIIRHPFNPIPTPVDVGAIDWLKTFGSADAVILEINESSMNSGHIRAFLKATLKGLPEPSPTLKFTSY